MQYLGRVKLGDKLRLQIRTKVATGVPTQPHISADIPPLVRIYSHGALVTSTRMATIDNPGSTGAYYADLTLNSSYAAGHYTAAVTWSVSSNGFLGHEEFGWQIIAGGSATGSVVVLTEHERPNGNFVIGQYDSGTVFQGRNPR